MTGQKVRRFLVFLLLWMLICCTMFSIMIERVMTTEVVVQYISEKNRQVPSEAIKWIEGEPHLYEVVDPQDWEGKMQIQEIGPEEYLIEADCVQLVGSRYLKCIVKWSKDFEAGGRACIVTALEAVNQEEALGQLTVVIQRMAVIGILMILQITVLGLFCLKSRHVCKWGYFCLFAGSMGIMVFLVLTLDIPSAVLPKTYFFDLSHYGELLQKYQSSR